MLNFTTQGTGPKLLLVHGLGSTRQAWSGILPALSEQRQVIALDLPGHGDSAPDADSATVTGLVRSVREFIEGQQLGGVDLVGSSLGARIALELARQGGVGAVVALNPGGFWRGWERTYARVSLLNSARLLRMSKALLPTLARNPAGRTALLAQLSARPWALDPKLVEGELLSFASTPTFDALVQDVTHAPEQPGPASPDSGPVLIGWGSHDRLCLPQQAYRAQAAFPGARLHWFRSSGHFPMWDQPEETAEVILSATGGDRA